MSKKEEVQVAVSEQVISPAGDEEAGNHLEVRAIPVQDIVENTHESRKAVNRERLESLKDSIQENGILVPLLVKSQPNNQYMIIAGQRRFLAAKELNLPTVPARIMDVDPLI